MRRALTLAALVAFLFACGVLRQEPPENGPGEVPAGSTGSVLRFAVIGDFGSGSQFERDVARRMCSWREDHPFDLVITTGDNVYPDGRPALFESKFFGPMSCLLDNEVQFHAVLGNHDIIRLQGRAQVHHPAFGMEGRNYVVRKNGVRLVMADSNRPVDLAWLREATRAQEGDRWTIVVFHHPVYSPAAQHGPSPWLQDMPELFATRGVDLVLSGHDHLYAVTKPLDRIRYVVTGGGGAALYDCAPSAVTEICTERHHFLYVVAGEDSISVRAVPTSGVPFDRFSTTGRGGV